MPKPLFIIAGQGVTEDKQSNLVTIFNVLERIKFKPQGLTDTPPAGSYFPFAAIAVWRAEAGDEAKEFEAELVLLKPPANEPQPLGIIRVTFQSGRPNHRFILQYGGPLPFSGPGVLRIESRIREIGAEHWMSQAYSIEIERETETAPVGR